MATYIVNVIETLTKKFEVEADSDGEARAQIVPLHESRDIVIDGTNADTYDARYQVALKADVAF